MVASLCMFNNSKIVFRAEQYHNQNMHMRIFPDLLLVVPASFKLAQMGSFNMLHPLSCLITFNIVGYINKRELNNCCGVSSICNSLHFELHLICSIVCALCHAMPHLNRTCIILVYASCHVYDCAFTMLFVYFWCCFLVPVILRL